MPCSMPSCCYAVPLFYAVPLRFFAALLIFMLPRLSA